MLFIAQIYYTNLLHKLNKLDEINLINVKILDFLQGMLLICQKASNPCHYWSLALLEDFFPGSWWLYGDINLVDLAISE